MSGIRPAQQRQEETQSGGRYSLTRRDALRLGVYGGAGLALAACGGATTPPAASAASQAPATAAATATPDPLANLIMAAKADGTLTWYTTVPPAPNAALAKAFTEAYGIKVEVNRQTSATLGPLLTAEVTSGKILVDVIELGDTGIMQQATDKGWFVKQNATTLPVLKDWPTKWAYGDAMYPQAIAVYGITYNKVLVGSDVPNEWASLTNPKWRGKILMTDPRTLAGPVEILKNLRKQYGDPFLKALAEQKMQFNASAVAGINSVAAGDVAIMFPGIHWITTDLMVKGAPIDDAFPQPAMSGSEQWVAQVKGGPHPNAAALFMNFSMSAAGQTATCENQCSSVLNVPKTIPFPSTYASPDASVPAATKAELLKLIGL